MDLPFIYEGLARSCLSSSQNGMGLQNAFRLFILAILDTFPGTAEPSLFYDQRIFLAEIKQPDMAVQKIDIEAMMATKMSSSILAFCCFVGGAVPSKLGYCLLILVLFSEPLLFPGSLH